MFRLNPAASELLPGASALDWFGCMEVVVD
jgi:hypothetical protein